MSYSGEKSDFEHRAPGGLELVRAFVNTLDVEDATDALADLDRARTWVSANDLPGLGEDVTEADRVRLLGVREALRALMLANNTGDAVPGEALEELNRQSETAAIGLRFDAGGSTLVTRCDGIDAAIARLLAHVHEAMEEGIWSRLKVCPAPDCLWAFFDHSRNRSGTWCQMGVCGNRAKARAYRERRKAEARR